jgi:hypothetical protein
MRPPINLVPVSELLRHIEELETVYAYAEPRRARDCWLWVVPRCPFCKKKHTHGGGPLDGDPRTYLYSRVAHCVARSGFDDVYELTDDAAKRVGR